MVQSEMLCSNTGTVYSTDGRVIRLLFDSDIREVFSSRDLWNRNPGADEAGLTFVIL